MQEPPGSRDVVGTEPSCGPHRILIVEDHPINRKLLRAQLEAEGKLVLEAVNGVEALKVLDREPVDAVISDILMPSMDGFRLCLEIRKREGLSDIPFILYTSTYNSPEDRQLAQIVGADRYVVKPAPARAILDALHEAGQRDRTTDPRPYVGADENFVLRQYSEALVFKLEERNAELQQAVDELKAAHESILALNRDLDLRVQQRTTELEAVNRELESFSVSVSHDLRAPLRAISGYIAILQRDHSGDLHSDALQLVRRIDQNVARMSALIEDLLQYSRLGRKALNFQVVDLSHLAAECLAELEHEREGREVEVQLNPLPVCRGDVILLKQALLNLIGNALKYSRSRRPARIAIGAQTEAGEFVCFVRDNGVGFDMQYAGKLFEVFQRLHSQSEFSGTGVGLAIVRRAIEKHGGRVWAEAEPDRGATFYFAIPASEGAA